MRIVVNDIAASKGGAITVLKAFYRCVKKYGGNHEWIFLLGNKYIEETENIQVYIFPKIKNNHFRKLIFDIYNGKKVIKRLNPDVYFSLQNITCFGLKCSKRITYIHQPIPFQKIKHFSFFKRSEILYAIYQYFIGFFIKMSAKKSTLNIVQTEWMKNEVCKQCSLPEDKVIKISPNVNNLADRIYNIKLDYKTFFYPTSNALYKNNECIYKASEILDKSGLKYTIKLTIQKEMKYNNIQYMGIIPYEKVIEEYSKSILIFPSYIETFGFPLIEARQVGTLVFASDCPFSRELLNGYENAYFFNPFCPSELAKLMKDAITGNIKLKTISYNHNINHDTWQDVIDILVK